MMFAILLDSELGPPRLAAAEEVIATVTLYSDPPLAIMTSFLPSSNGADLTSQHVT